MNACARLVIFACLTAVPLVPTASIAKTECPVMNVAAAEIPHFIETAQKGEFIELIRSAAKRADLELNIQLFPKKRALSLFLNGKVDALVPHSSAGKDLPSYKSMPILTKRDFVFVRRGMPIPTSVEELEGLRIGLTTQYAYPKALTSNTKIEFSRAPNSDLANIKMLSLGRFDGSIIEERSGLQAISAAGVTDIVYDKSQPINELLVWIMFSKTECGLYYRVKINSEFLAMKTDGEWNSIKGLSGSED
ncbi:MAG: transporter substrate-binding domain-containing protein [Roseibium sp.]